MCRGKEGAGAAYTVLMQLLVRICENKMKLFIYS